MSAETSTGFTTDELLAVLLSRELRDEEAGILGTKSEIGYAACRLAQHFAAPGLWVMSGPSGVVNPGLDRILPIADDGLVPGSEALLELSDNIDAIDWSHRFFDFAILGGMQVDRFGNLNTVAIGGWQRPKVRGPGAIGASVLAAHAGRFFILMPQHNQRVFVPAVDFVSALGHGRTGVERRELQLPGAGPELLMSPIGVFDFSPDSKALRLKALAPGVTLDQAVSATGFPLELESEAPPTVRPPTSEELRILRTKVDTSGVLRGSQPEGRSA